MYDAEESKATNRVEVALLVGPASLTSWRGPPSGRLRMGWRVSRKRPHFTNADRPRCVTGRVSVVVGQAAVKLGPRSPRRRVTLNRWRVGLHCSDAPSCVGAPHEHRERDLDRSRTVDAIGLSLRIDQEHKLEVV